MRVIRSALGAIIITAAIALAGGSTALAGGQHQVVVCKYVGTPGVDERLQTGQNPIVVDTHALEGDGFNGTFPFEFSDAQGRSIAIRYAANSHDGDISECPGYVEPTPSPTVEPSESPTPSSSPTPEPSASPSQEPSPSVSPSNEPSETPSVTPEPSQGDAGGGGESTPKPRVTAPPTDTMPNTATVSDAQSGANLSLLLAAFVGIFAGLYMLQSPTPATRRNRR